MTTPVTLALPPAVVISPTGVQGPRGTGILHGAGAPAGSLGTDGDFYIDNTLPAALVIYGPKTAGTWGAGVPLGAGSGSTYYLHTQASPAATWQVAHGLGRTPNIALIDTGGRVVYADIVHNSTSLAVIQFPSAVTGTAMCS